MLQKPHLSHGLAHALREIVFTRTALFQDRHALSVAGMAADGRVNDGVLERHAPPQQRMVLADGGPVMDLLGEPLMREVVFSDNQKPRCIFVQAMHDAGPDRAAQGGKMGTGMGQEGVDQRSRLRAGRGMDDQPLLLVDAQHVGVFVDNVQRDVFRLHVFQRAGGRDGHNDFVAEAGPVARFAGFAVDQNGLGRNQALDMGAGQVRQALGDKHVQADVAFVVFDVQSFGQRATASTGGALGGRRTGGTGNKRRKTAMPRRPIAAMPRHSHCTSVRKWMGPTRTRSEVVPARQISVMNRSVAVPTRNQQATWPR